MNNGFYRIFGKKFFDKFFSLVAIILLSPLYLFLIILIRINLGSPVFFRQLRPGLYGKPFNIIKFRTMTNKVDDKGRLLPNEKRVTPLGRFLRSTSLDELPELFNVLKGEMSFVGPRPLLMDYLKLYNKDELRRHEVLGGITGLAQINGRNNLEFTERFKLDVYYVDNFSFSMDIKILFLTIKKVFCRESVVLDERKLRENFEKKRN